MVDSYGKSYIETHQSVVDSYGKSYIEPHQSVVDPITHGFFKSAVVLSSTSHTMY